MVIRGRLCYADCVVSFTLEIVLQETEDDLFDKHKDEWRDIYETGRIQIDGNLELVICLLSVRFKVSIHLILHIFNSIGRDSCNMYMNF